MKLKLLFSVLLIILSIGVQAQYTLTDDDVVVENGVLKSYSGTATDVVIPNELDGQVITSIGHWAFRNKGLNKIKPI